MFTLLYLRSILFYDPDDGWFYNLVQRGKRGPIGAPAGSYDKDGYVVIQIDGVKYKAHRLAYMYMTGEWPEDEIDHWDGVPWNNVWNNLRDATHSDNMCNADRALGESGFRGVKFDPATRTWRARIGYGYQRQYIGAYSTAEEASIAYLAGAKTVHGEFALQNRNSYQESNLWQ